MNCATQLCTVNTRTHAIKAIVNLINQFGNLRHLESTKTLENLQQTFNFERKSSAQILKIFSQEIDNIKILLYFLKWLKCDVT